MERIHCIADVCYRSRSSIVHEHPWDDDDFAKSLLNLTRLKRLCLLEYSPPSRQLFPYSLLPSLQIGMGVLSTFEGNNLKIGDTQLAIVAGNPSLKRVVLIRCRRLSFATLVSLTQYCPLIHSLIIRQGSSIRLPTDRPAVLYSFANLVRFELCLASGSVFAGAEFRKEPDLIDTSFDWFIDAMLAKSPLRVLFLASYFITDACIQLLRQIPALEYLGFFGRNLSEGLNLSNLSPEATKLLESGTYSNQVELYGIGDPLLAT